MKLSTKKLSTLLSEVICNEDIEVTPEAKTEEIPVVPVATEVVTNTPETTDVVAKMAEATAQAEILRELVDELRLQRQDLKDEILSLKAELKDKQDENAANEEICFTAEKYDSVLKKSLNIIKNLNSKLITANESIKMYAQMEDNSVKPIEVDTDATTDIISEPLIFTHDEKEIIVPEETTSDGLIFEFSGN